MSDIIQGKSINDHLNDQKIICKRLKFGKRVQTASCEDFRGLKKVNPNKTSVIKQFFDTNDNNLTSSNCTTFLPVIDEYSFPNSNKKKRNCLHLN